MMNWKPVSELPKIKKGELLSMICWQMDDEEDGGEWGMCYVDYTHRMFVLDEEGELLELIGATHFCIPTKPIV